MLSEWEGLYTNGKDFSMDTIGSLLRNARTVVRLVSKSIPDERGSPVTDWKRLLLSLYLLFDAIGESAERILGRFRDSIEIGPSSREMLLAPVLRESGWCPHSMQLAFGWLPLPALCYLYSLRPYPMTRTHEFCNDEICYALQSSADAEAVDVLPDCTCASIGPSQRDVVRVIEAGGIPIVEVRKDLDGSSDWK
jgi:hypothetical protein